MVSCIDALMLTCKQIAIRVFVTCMNLAIRAFFTCKKLATIAFGILKKIAITAFGPILEYGLYYYDLFSDSFFSYTMASNCHWRYFAVSICIMVSSYFVTVAYLRYHVQVTMFVTVMCHTVVLQL